MSIDFIRALCLSLPHVTEEIQWEDRLLFKIGGRMFVVTALGPTGTRLSLKTTPEKFAELTRFRASSPRRIWPAASGSPSSVGTLYAAVKSRPSSANPTRSSSPSSRRRSNRNSANRTSRRKLPKNSDLSCEQQFAEGIAWASPGISSSIPSFSAFLCPHETLRRSFLPLWARISATSLPNRPLGGSFPEQSLRLRIHET